MGEPRHDSPRGNIVCPACGIENGVGRAPKYRIVAHDFGPDECPASRLDLATAEKRRDELRAIVDKAFT